MGAANPGTNVVSEEMEKRCKHTVTIAQYSSNQKLPYVWQLPWVSSCVVMPLILLDAYATLATLKISGKLSRLELFINS